VRQHRHTFTLDYLPPSVNHMYGVSQNGKRFVTPEARSLRDDIRLEAQRVGFRPDKKHTYAVVVVFYMPDWDTSDLDSGLKALLDSAFSSRTDHRIVHLLVDKRVQHGCKPRTVVEIWRISGAWGLVGWMIRLLMRELGGSGLREHIADVAHAERVDHDKQEEEEEE
jgi:hypothetical protein